MGEEKRTPTIDFYTFCLSLGSSAFVHLGDAPHPETGIPAADLLMAKQTIDILIACSRRAKGNLTEEEARFMGPARRSELRREPVEREQGLA
jgi:hypothetical protein